MASQNDFQLPVFIIKQVRPLLTNDDLVFAYEITLTTKDLGTFKAYENKGLDLSDYINHKMECLLEITRGEFKYNHKEDKKTKDINAFQYQWLRRPYELFPELSDLREKSNDRDSKLKDFDKIAEQFFKDWGLNGLNIGIYQAKPLLKAPFGVFFLNEHEFEEDIEYFELKQEVFIEIEEMFLRGIRPFASSGGAKQKVFSQPKPKEEPTQPMTNQEIPEKKKGRFDSLLDWKNQNK